MKRFFIALLTTCIPLAGYTSQLILNTLAVENRQKGYAIGVWVVDGMIQTAIYNNATQNWSPTQDLSSEGSRASNPHVSKDPYGDAVVVWQNSTDGNNFIEAAFFNSSSGVWSEPEILSSFADDSINPKVSKDVSGTAIAVWETTDQIHHSIESSIYDPRTQTWSVPEQISDSQFHSFDPQVSVDTDGNGITLFRRANSSEESVIQSATYSSNNAAWSATRDVSKSGYFATTPQIGTDASGNAIAVVHPQGDANYTIMIHALLGEKTVLSQPNIPRSDTSYTGTNISHTGTNISHTGADISHTGADFSHTRADLHTPSRENNTHNAPASNTVESNPLITNNHSNNQSNSSASIEANVNVNTRLESSTSAQDIASMLSIIQASIPSIPTNFKTLLQKNVFPTQIEWFTTLSWDAPVDNSNIVNYRIYLNGSVAVTIAATDLLSYVVHNIDVDGSYTFELCSVTAVGTESDKVTLKLF
ncbi:hypothetical protein COB21_01580 [Candidatus Aerophobetes bacterium]|uniref:Fibronectin type-III domain-containing protein n=1 Tax=Aerophobetes bacterium TaxID=2030807 RepID=A0A2A4X7Z6_UNCAE|nr:MAG: hypothetical protein COB21_01580 [Candidatus Aerophobetes bacterium]